MNWQGDNYSTIIVMVDNLTKKVYYEPDKTTIDIADLVEVIINVLRSNSFLAVPCFWPNRQAGLQA